MKKIVLKLELEDGKAKQKALKTVAALQGIDSISMDMKEKKLTVTGIVDPVRVVKKLRKYWPDTAMMLVGPAKDPEKPPPSPEKKEEPAKSDAAKKGSEEEQPKEGPNQAGGEEGKKEGSDNTDGKKEGENMMSTGGLVVVDGKPLHPPPDPVLELVKAYKAYNPQMTTYYYVPSMEENPNACAIC